MSNSGECLGMSGWVHTWVDEVVVVGYWAI